MVTVKSSQKIFTDSEVASLTGICLDHIHKFARTRHLGFIARGADDLTNLELGLPRLEKAAHTSDTVIEQMIENILSEAGLRLREAA